MTVGAPVPEPGPVTERIALRAAGALERESIFAWHADGLRNHIERLWGWDDAWQRQDFARHFALVPPKIIVVDGADAGYFQARREAGSLHLHNIVIAAEVRNQGVGSVLLRHLQHCGEAQHLPVTLAVFKTNPRARTFYEQLGFVATQRSRNHVHMIWRARQRSSGWLSKIGIRR